MKMSFLNRIANSGNPYQGDFKRVLCVCSAGLLRSPSTAVVLSQEPYNFNTRAAGLTPEYALVPVDDVLLHWAEEIVCMEPEQKVKLDKMVSELGLKTTVLCLDVPDQFPYRNPQLMKMIAQKYDSLTISIQKKDDNEEK